MHIHTYTRTHTQNFIHLSTDFWTVQQWTIFLFMAFVRSLSCVQLCYPLDCSALGFPVLHYLPEFAQIHVHWVSDAIEPCHPLLPPSPFAFNLFQHQSLFEWIGSSHHVMMLGSPKCWNFSISPSNEYSGLISFRIDWFDLFAVQGILKSLLQHHNLNASVFQCPTFFMVQLSHLYMTTGKTVALTIWAFVGKVISLLFTMLSRLVIALKWTINLLKKWQIKEKWTKALRIIRFSSKFHLNG